jgi:hypothetical protein
LWDAFDLDNVHQPNREAAITSNDAINLDFACADNLDCLLSDICESQRFTDNYDQW